MRRIPRYIFRGLAFVPVVAVLMLWYRSMDTEDWVGLMGERSLAAASAHGRLAVETFKYDDGRPETDVLTYSVGCMPDGSFWESTYADSGNLHAFAGFSVAWGNRMLWARAPDSPESGSTAGMMPSAYGYVLALPYWFLGLLSLLLPALFLRKPLRRYRRARRGLCLECGYDVRASSLRCPECGTALPPRSQRVTAGGVEDTRRPEADR